MGSGQNILDDTMVININEDKSSHFLMLTVLSETRRVREYYHLCAKVKFVIISHLVF